MSGRGARPAPRGVVRGPELRGVAPRPRGRGSARPESDRAPREARGARCSSRRGAGVTTGPAMRVAVATERNADDIVAMLKKSFFPLEPLNASIGLVDAAGGCPELEAYCRAAVCSGLSLCVRDEDGALIGVILNDLVRREDAPAAEDARVRADATKFDKILAVNHAAELAGDVFAEHPDLDQLLDVKILATDPDHTKRGVAALLIEETKRVARSRGESLLRCVCSGAYSARVAERAGFSKIGVLPYAQFTGPDGAPVFSPPPPHTAITVWALRLHL